MKKAGYLSSIRLWALWVEIPLVLLLIWILNDNNKVEGILKLYPLLIMTIAAMIFVVVFFARFVKISYAEIRAVGPFSSKDSVIINAGKVIKLVKQPFGKVQLSVIGHDVACGLEWMKPEDRIRDITLFKSVVYGGDLAIKYILSYYGANAADLDELVKREELSKKYDFITVTVGVDENGAKEYTIRIDETI